MTLIAPWLALGLLLALVPALLVLWILRLRRARIRVPAQWLWSDAREDLRAQVPFQRLRWSILLLLQLIALGLLLLAAARPRVVASLHSGGRTVLMIDTSASMHTRDASQGRRRFDAAREAVRGAIDRLHPGGLMDHGGGQTMLVTLGARPQIVQPFTSSRAVLLQALESIDVTDEPATLTPALDLAHAWAAVPDPDAGEAPTEGTTHLEVFSDGGLADLVDALDGLDAPLVLQHVGAEDTPNAAIARIGGTRDPADPAKLTPWVSVMHWAAQAASVKIRLVINGEPSSVRAIELPAATEDGPGRVDVMFPAVRSAGRTALTAELVPGDALAEDDIARCIVPESGGARVAQMGKSAPLLRRALAALGLHAAGDESPDLVVAVSDTTAALPAVPSLSFGAPPVSAMVKPAATVPDTSIATSSHRHAVSRGSRLTGIRAAGAHVVQVDPGVRVLASSREGPLIVAWREQGVPRIHVGFEPSRSTWPQREDFITFLVDATAWLVGIDDEAGGHVAGDRIELALPAQTTSVDVQFNGDTIDTFSPADPSRAIWGPAPQAGVYAFHWASPDAQGVREAVVNMPVAVEGDTRRGAFTIDDPLLEARRASDRGVPLWPFAVIGAVLTLIAEWWIWVKRQ